MLSINGLHNFYYLPELHDMRCKAQRICEIIRGRYHRDPLNGDVYMFMSKDQRKVRMIHYERNAYYRKHSKKCTFYTLRFGCSFATVNTIKPQLL